MTFSATRQNEFGTKTGGHFLLFPNSFVYLQSSANLLWLFCVIVQLFSQLITASSSSSGYGGNSLIGSSLSSYGQSGGGDSGGGESKGPITAAVETHRSVEVKPVQMVSEPHQPQVIEVPSDDMPVTVHFKSQSSRVLVQQTHTPGKVFHIESSTEQVIPLTNALS